MSGVGGDSIQGHYGRIVMGVLQKFVEKELLVIALFSLRCPWTLPALAVTFWIAPGSNSCIASDLKWREEPRRQES